MPTATYIALANVTLSGSDTDVQFGSIPNTYRDLVIVVNGQSNSDNRAFYIRFNGAGEDVNTSMILTSNNSVSSDAGLWIETDTSKGLHIIQVMDYSASNKHKSVLIRTNRPTASQVRMVAGRWKDNSVINTVNISRSGYSLTAGTTITLFGIAG